VVANALQADNTVANISLTGTGTIITSAVTLSNDGTLTIGDGDGENLCVQWRLEHCERHRHGHPARCNLQQQ